LNRYQPDGRDARRSVEFSADWTPRGTHRNQQDAGRVHVNGSDLARLKRSKKPFDGIPREHGVVECEDAE
jgi:hypothetical protein